MASSIFVLKDKQQSGPYSEEDVRKKIQEGEISRETLVWYPDLKEWQRLDATLPLLFSGIPWLPHPRASFSFTPLNVFLTILGLFYYGVPFVLAKGVVHAVSAGYAPKVFDAVSLLFFLWFLGSRRFWNIDRLKSYILGSTLNRKLWMRAHLVSACVSVVLLVWAFLPPGLFTRIPEDQGWWPFIIIYLKLLGVVFAFYQLRSDVKDVRAMVKFNGAGGQDVPDLEAISLPAPSGERMTLVCHFTDLHLTRPKGQLKPGGSPLRVADMPTMSGEGANVWNKFRQTLEGSLEQVRAAHCLLVTGDVTDTGAPAEWRLFHEAFKDMEDLLEKLVILPGNHDVNIFHALPIYLADGFDAPQRRLNLIRMLYAVQLFQGKRTYVVSKEGGLVPFLGWFAGFEADLGKFYSVVPQRTYMPVYTGEGAGSQIETTPDHVKALIELPERVFFEAFPMVVEVPGCEALFLLLDSNLPSSNIATNAFGFLNERQAMLTKELLSFFAENGRPVVIAMHHHVGNPPAGLMPKGKDAWQDRGLTLANPMGLLGSLPSHRTQILFNGHRHRRYVGKIENLVVVSGPSTTLGDSCQEAGKRRPGFGLYGLTWASDSSLRQAYERWIEA